MDYKNILTDVVGTMLEEAAFVFSDPINNEEKISAKTKSDLIGFRISFSNFAKGQVLVFSEKKVANLIAANMLGCDEEDDYALENSEGALQEFTNILAGNLITAIYGTKPVIDLSLPEKVKFDKDIKNFNKSAIIWMEVEENFLSVRFIEE